MKKVEIGDTVRFLNTVGGGKVKGFVSKQVVLVEDEHGFDVPVLVSECVVIEPAGNVKMEQSAEKKQPDQKVIAKPDIQETDDLTEETPEGEQITACLAFLPTDVKNISSSSYECYLVNDSNYYLFFNYMRRENNSWKSRFNGSIEPNTKIFIEEFDKTQLNELEKVCVQFIAFKYNKPYKFKNPCSVELRIDTVKFYKLHSFRENDYFDEDALVYYIIRNDVPEREMLISAGDIEKAIREKETLERRPRRERIVRKEKPEVLEIDLHINELIDTTVGMNNADIIEYQLKKFHETMKENMHNKNKKIVFIHGKGDGVLKNALLKELKNAYPKCFYQDASFQEYGYGATMITIK